MKTPITYFGGKQTMLKYILPLIPAHTTYTESFCGGAAVLFAKAPVESEVINDINMHLTNFYWVSKIHLKELKKEIDKTLHSRDTHAHATHILKYPSFFTYVERAWAVWVLSKTSFASMLDGTFGYDFKGMMPKKLRNAKKEFTYEIANRLDFVTIENRNALDIISTYDNEDAFHFVDPPYINTSCAHYEDTFNELDLDNLLQLLVTIKGKFMLTMFPNETIQSYADKNNWIIHKITRTISAAKDSRRKQEEWMVCNYEQENKQGSLFAQNHL